MTSTIPLCKGYDKSKLVFPVYTSVKLDGVPIRIDVIQDGQQLMIGVQSRSGKPVLSVEPLVRRFVVNALKEGVKIDTPMTFVAEVTHATLRDFKDVSGVVRKQSPQKDLVLNFFDYCRHVDSKSPFATRHKELRYIVDAAKRQPMGFDFHCVPQGKMTETTLDDFLSLPCPETIEGYIIRSGNAEWKPDTRHWDYQKVVVDPTADLKIVGFEEAMSEAGEPRGMVGRVWANYKGKIIGVGPGKLTHKERKDLWEEWRHWQGAIRSGYKDTPWGRMACIKYKRDPSYTALRQPTFQHWRDDKEEVSYE